MNPEHPNSLYLSKSDFAAARTCPTKLFYRKCGYPSLVDDDEYLALLAWAGFKVQKIATLLCPEGREMPVDAAPPTLAAETLHALRAHNVTLFEATLISNGKLARIDILRKRGNEFHLIEVKATSYDTEANAAAIADGRPNLFRTKRKQAIAPEWREYLEDAAFQALVLRELFPQATIRAFLLMPDKSKITRIDGLHSLFRLHRRPGSVARLERFEVEFTGNVEELRREDFLTLVSVDAEVGMLTEEVGEAAAEYITSLRPCLRKMATPLSATCRTCEYRAAEAGQPDGFRECWGALADVEPHLLDLYRVGTVGGQGGPAVQQLIHQEKVKLTDVPRGSLVKADGSMGETNKRQLIQIDHTRDNSEWISDELSDILRAYPSPLHFIDFETAAAAIPYHAGMHPYEPVAFQWSCHTLEAPGSTLRHAEWINVEDAFPNFEFADTLMRCLGTEGTVLTWASHENTILTAILRQMSEREHPNLELQHWLQSIVGSSGANTGRLVDMHRICLRHYFHPAMKGSTSVKKVCDAVWQANRNLRKEFPEYFCLRDGRILSPYEALPPLEIGGQTVAVADGTGAIRAYEAMLYGVERDDPVAKARWRDLLLQYCRLDTLAMTWIWRHWITARP